MPNVAAYFRQHLTTPDKVLYRHCVDGEWRDVAVSELAALIVRWQAALSARGLREGDRVGVCLRNGLDWVALDLAALGLGLVVVPLYVEDNPDNAAWCAANAEARLLVVENARMIDALGKAGSAVPPILQSRGRAASESASATAPKRHG